MCKNNKNSSFFMISIVKLWQYVLQLDLKSYCCCLTWRICILTTSHVVRWKAVRLAAESKNEGIWMSTYRNDVPHPIRCHFHEDMCVTKKRLNERRYSLACMSLCLWDTFSHSLISKIPNVVGISFPFISLYIAVSLCWCC